MVEARFFAEVCLSSFMESRYNFQMLTEWYLLHKHFSACWRNATRSVVYLVMVSGTVVATSCVNDARSGNKQPSSVNDAAKISLRSELRAMILSLPERYHEETRESFVQSLLDAESLPRNVTAPPNELYCPGDGSFGAREFFWDEQKQILTVLIHEADGMPASTDRWRKTASGWISI